MKKTGKRMELTFLTVLICFCVLKISVRASQIVLQPVHKKAMIEGVAYYDKGVAGTISLDEGEELLKQKHSIYAIAQDDTAKAQSYMPGNGADREISDVTYRKVQGKTVLSFTFDLPGRWKIALMTEKNQKKHQEIAAEEEIVIDKEAPVLAVRYNGVQMISDLCHDLTHMDQDIQTSLKRIRSSGNEVFLSSDHEVILELNEDYYDAQKLSLTVFEEYFIKGSTIPYKRDITDEVMEQSAAALNWVRLRRGVYRCRIQFKREGHYRILVQGEDVFGRRFKTEHMETASCMDGSGYESPRITFDRTSPQIFCEQKGEKVFLDVVEENFDTSEVHITDEQLTAGKEPESETVAISGNSLKWNCVYENGVRHNRAEVTLNSRRNHQLRIKVYGREESKAVTLDVELVQVEDEKQEEGKGEELTGEKAEDLTREKAEDQEGEKDAGKQSDPAQENRNEPAREDLNEPAGKGSMEKPVTVSVPSAQTGATASKQQMQTDEGKDTKEKGVNEDTKKMSKSVTAGGNKGEGKVQTRSISRYRSTGELTMKEDKLSDADTGTKVKTADVGVTEDLERTDYRRPVRKTGDLKLLSQIREDRQSISRMIQKSQDENDHSLMYYAGIIAIDILLILFLIFINKRGLHFDGGSL